MKKPTPKPISLEIAIGAVTVLLSTLSFLLGSTTLALLALVIGAVSFGIVLGARSISSD